MPSEVIRATVQGAEDLRLDDAVLRVLRQRLPGVATTTVAAVVSEVPDYAGALFGAAGSTIEQAVQMAIAGFLKLAGRGRDVDPSAPLGPTREGAYALGRGEARSGRSMDSLLAAYRIGARVSWRELAGAAAEAGVEAATMAKFAELLFAYIDELSAASVAGHTDELTTSGRVRDRYRERLAQHLLAGAGADVLTAAAARAEWTTAHLVDSRAASGGPGPPGSRVPRRRDPPGRRRPARQPGRPRAPGDPARSCRTRRGPAGCT